MYATHDKDYRGLRTRRAAEREMFGNAFNNAKHNIPVSMESMVYDDTPYIDNDVTNNNYAPVIENPYYVNPVQAVDTTQPVIQKTATPEEEITYEPTPMDRLNQFQKVFSLMGMNDAAQYINPFNVYKNTFAEGGDKKGIYSSNNFYHVAPEDYEDVLNTVEGNEPLDVVLPQLTTTAKKPDLHLMIAKQMEDAAMRNKLDNFLSSVTINENHLGDVQDNTVVSNGATYGKPVNPQTMEKAYLGSKAVEGWQKDHPTLNSWGMLLGTIPIAVASYPFLAGTSDIAMGSALGQTALSRVEPLVNMAMRSSKGWLPWVDSAVASYFGADAVYNDLLNGKVTPETALELAPLTRVSKGIAQGAKDVSKAAYNLYDNGTIWDRYTTFRGRFGNYSDNPFVNAYATYARRHGLPDKARIPADVIRKLRMQNGEVLPVNNMGLVDFTGNKSWNNNPHINVTTDRGVTSHKSGWDGADTYVFSTQDFLNQTMPNGSLKSIEPSDMFANGSKVLESPNKVTLISGDKEALKSAKAAGMQTLSSPRLRRMYNKQNTGSILAKSPKAIKHWIEYSNEVNRLLTLRGTPTLSDYKLLESKTGLKAGVAPLSEYTNAVNSLYNMVHANTTDIMNGLIKQYVYPNGRVVDWSDAQRQLNLITNSPYNKVFYDPATYAEFNWRSTQ